ncbi:Uncharacterized protein TCM_034975 [Theobroma cacao]|uniref:Uncharacterized protein n=1 Tax=Theobroma cacao TaxID=3641 RepID=A0A061FFJ0_THECC|nr:Uncharacterized protein TCM_034975 [Theobroma cacao]
MYYGDDQEGTRRRVQIFFFSKHERENLVGFHDIHAPQKENFTEGRGTGVGRKNRQSKVPARAGGNFQWGPKY